MLGSGILAVSCLTYSWSLLPPPRHPSIGGSEISTPPPQPEFATRAISGGRDLKRTVKSMESQDLYAQPKLGRTGRDADIITPIGNSSSWASGSRALRGVERPWSKMTWTSYCISTRGPPSARLYLTHLLGIPASSSKQSPLWAIFTISPASLRRN